MKKYLVWVTCSNHIEVEVDAENVEDAISKAIDDVRYEGTRYEDFDAGPVTELEED